jgi:hypothetical protein
MSALGRSLHLMGQQHTVGSRMTQADRHRAWQRFAAQLNEGGYKLPEARSLKRKHVDFLVNSWLERHEAGELKLGHIKNDVAHLRAWAKCVGKADMIPRKNKDLGIGERDSSKENKARTLDLATVEKLPDERMKLATRLMAAFGLRQEEALKFTPSKTKWLGDRIGIIIGTKGGRYREIPILSDKQRALLDDVKTVAAGGSLVPPDKSYKQFLNAYCYQKKKAGIKHVHGLRHHYAQVRYKMMTGKPCPRADSPNYNAMTPNERGRDEAARWQVSRELGHGRIYVTTTYLG